MTADPSSPAGLRQVAACAARLGPRRATLTSEEDARPRGPPRRARHPEAHRDRRVVGHPRRGRVRAPLPERGGPDRARLARRRRRRRRARRAARAVVPARAARGVLPARQLPRDLGRGRSPRDGRAPRGQARGRAAADGRGGRPRAAAPHAGADRAALRDAADLRLRPVHPGRPAGGDPLGAQRDGAYLARLLGVEPIGNALAPTAQIEASSDDDIGRFLATTCIEARLPWKPDAPQAGRAAALRAQLQTLAPKLVPFPPALVASFSAEPACAAWPPTTPQSPVALTAPPVPTLILSGREDLRTPTEDARRTAALYPNVRLLAVPDVGHSVLTSDPGSCAIRGVAAFLAGAPVANCARSARTLDEPASFVPASLDGLRPMPGVPGRAGRTLTAVFATILDESRAVTRGVLSGERRVGGLRRGTATFSPPANSTLRDYEVVRGVRVSGTLRFTQDHLRGRFTVTGPSAATGSLTLDDVRGSGTLGGRRFSRVRLTGPLTG